MKRKPKNSPCIDRTVRIDPSDPDKSDIRRAVGILNRQGVLVFPTTGLYGLGADAFSPEAVSRVFAIKQRPQGMPLLVMVPDLDEMDRVVRCVPDFARPLMRLWPGGITLVFEAGEGVPSVLTGGTGKIGIRMPAHPVAKELVRHFGGPITATSANRSGSPAVYHPANLDPRHRCRGGFDRGRRRSCRRSRVHRAGRDLLAATDDPGRCRFRTKDRGFAGNEAVKLIDNRSAFPYITQPMPEW